MCTLDIKKKIFRVHNDYGWWYNYFIFEDLNMEDLGYDGIIH